jgi:hypothetical protein
VADVPLWVVTVMSTVPATAAGAIAMMEVSEITLNVTAAVPPNETPVAPVKALPMIVTLVPPVTGPDVGVIFVTVGSDAAT